MTSVGRAPAEPTETTEDQFCHCGPYNPNQYRGWVPQALAEQVRDDFLQLLAFVDGPELHLPD